MRIIFIILVLIIPWLGFTQDPQLFENDWYVHKVVIDNEEYFPTLIGNLWFFADDILIGHPYCEDYTGSFITYVNEDQFDLTDYWSAIGLCADPYYVDFMLKHYEIYFENPPIPMNPFSYIIVSDGNNKTLTITNGVGNYAVYGDEILSVPEFNKSSIGVYPNPVNEMLTIENLYNFEITSIRIYDILGKLVMESVDVEQIHVSNLNSGIFFVKIETNQGSITKKVVKL